MRLTDRLHEAGIADDYTPATDLVFSMLALTLLLLAIFGAGSHVTEGASRVALEHRKSEVDLLETDRGRLAEQTAELAAELERAKAQIRELEATLALRPLPKPGSPDASRDRLARDLQVLERQYAEKTRQYETIMDELKEAQRLARAEVRLPPISAESFGSLLDSDGRIAPAVVAEVARGLASIRDQVSERRLNEVVVTIETGHVPGRSSPSGPDDESFETFLVGAALLRGLWATPLPPACVAMEPLGRVRSSGLVDRLVMPGAGSLLEHLVSKGGAMDGEALKQRAEQLAAKDRRILVAARRVEKSPCSFEALRRALDAM